MKNNVDLRIPVFYSAATIALLTIIALLFLNNDKLDKSIAAITQSQEVINASNGLFSEILHIETDTRGYILTLDANFINSNASTIDSINRKIMKNHQLIQCRNLLHHQLRSWMQFRWLFFFLYHKLPFLRS